MRGINELVQKNPAVLEGRPGMNKKGGSYEKFKVE
jgi:hypothetical protein